MKGKKQIVILYAIFGVICTACSISYSFSGSSIDYETTKTITISDFPNQAALVSPPLAQRFTETLKDIYIRQTRLEMVPVNGDMDIEGEITGYDLAPMAIKDDAYSSQTKLTLTIRVRYSNRANPDKDFEQTFSAYREFDANQMLETVQDELNAQLTQEIAEQIFNATAADW